MCAQKEDKTAFNAAEESWNKTVVRKKTKGQGLVKAGSWTAGVMYLGCGTSVIESAPEKSFWLSQRSRNPFRKVKKMGFNKMTV